MQITFVFFLCLRLKRFTSAPVALARVPCLKTSSFSKHKSTFARQFLWSFPLYCDQTSGSNMSPVLGFNVPCRQSITQSGLLGGVAFFSLKKRQQFISFLAKENHYQLKARISCSSQHTTAISTFPTCTERREKSDFLLVSSIQVGFYLQSMTKLSSP